MKKVLLFLLLSAVAFCTYNPSRFPNGIETNIIKGDKSVLRNNGSLSIFANTLNAQAMVFTNLTVTTLNMTNIAITGSVSADRLLANSVSVKGSATFTGTISANGGIYTLATLTANKLVAGTKSSLGVPSLSSAYFGGLASDNITGQNKGIVQIDASSGIATIFGGLNSSPYTSYIQAIDDRSGVSTTYPLALNPSGGNVGIGTTAPSTKLEVAGTVSASTLIVNGQITAKNNTAVSSPGFSGGTGSFTTGTAGGYGIIDMGSFIASPFSTWVQATNGAGAAKAIVLNPLGGNIGINTSTNPVVALEVAGTVSASALQVNGQMSNQNILVDGTVAAPYVSFFGSLGNGYFVQRNGSSMTMSGGGSAALKGGSVILLVSDASSYINNNFLVTGNLTVQKGLVGVTANFTGTVSANDFGTGWTAFTPTFNAAVITFNTVVGSYKRVGKEISVKMYAQATVTAVGVGSAVNIGSLPFPVSNTASLPLGTGLYLANSAIVPFIAMYNNANEITFMRHHFTAIQGIDVSVGPRSMSITFTYTTP